MSYLSPIVIDNGSGSIKAGFSGDGTPRSIFPSMVGKYNDAWEPKMAGMHRRDRSIGDDARCRRGYQEISFPIQRGAVTSWTDMEALWHHTFYNELRHAPEAQALIMIHSPTKGLHDEMIQAEKTAMYMFETMSVPMLSLCAIPAYLSVVAAGLRDGVGMDVGHGVSHAVVVAGGRPLAGTLRSSEVGGHDVTERLAKLLRDQYVFTTAAEMDIVSAIKEAATHVTYELPDETVINIGPEKIKSALDVMWGPLGVHEVLRSAMQVSPTTLPPHTSVVVSGQTIAMDAFRGCFLEEWPCVSVDPCRRFGAWNGASLLGSMPLDAVVWVTKAEYDDVGPGAMKKCVS